MERMEVKQKLGSVCDVCVNWANCEKAEQLYEVGCENFELEQFIECSVPCEQCYLYALQLCKGFLEVR